MMDFAKQWETVGGPGHWPDCDMIQIGKLSKRGPVGKERYSRFTNDELITHFTFWCIYRSPLMLGGNLPENRELELKIFTNQEVLEVNQRGENPRQLYKNANSMVWVSQVSGTNEKYVALFNIGDSTHKVAVDFAQLGFKGKVAVRDLWKKAGAGVWKKKYEQAIPAHGSLLLRFKGV
jgi:alpha-galactosidase